VALFAHRAGLNLEFGLMGADVVRASRGGRAGGHWVAFPQFGVLRAVLLLLVLLWSFEGHAAPFARFFTFSQPDGTMIQLWGQGDEFHAVFETPEGYTVVFVPEDRAYDYARLSDDRTRLESTGVRVGQAAPEIIGLETHLRIAAEARRQLIRQNHASWDALTRQSDRWTQLKQLQSRTGSVSPMGPPARPTLGVKCGLTVLVDFDDEPGSIPREEVVRFLNGDDYTGYGNHGSVKQYFWDCSAGHLLFTNMVTAYVRIPNSLHPRSYYNDVTRYCSDQGNLLVRDALSILKQSSNYNREVVPALRALTYDAQNTVVSANFFVSGHSSGVWSHGIWGHQSTLYAVGAQSLWQGGPKVNIYQLSPMGDDLEIFTFSHENGHMLCDFPDLYDYDTDSYGGAASYCLMGYGTTDVNPPQVCAYLKLAAGWASAIDVRSGMKLNASLAVSGTGFNRFYRWNKPGISTEYYLLENRQQTAHDADLPGAGVAVWHVDELGNRDDQNVSPNSSHDNFELTLVAADNQWHFEYAVNQGDPQDLFYAGNRASGYVNEFSDLTSPSANWWDGTRSGLRLSDFSANDQTMSFTLEVVPLVFSRDPADQTVFEGASATFSCQLADSIPNGAKVQWLKDGTGLLPSDRLSGLGTLRFSISDATSADAGQYAAVVTLAAGSITSRIAQLTVLAKPSGSFSNIACSGNVTILPDGFDLRSTGAGLKSTSDAFSAMVQEARGDFDLRAQLKGLNIKSDATRAGLTIRESLNPRSRHVSVSVGLTSEHIRPCSVQARRANGGPAELILAVPTAFATPAVLADFWLRLKREGDVFSVYQSTNGARWILLQTVTLALTNRVYAGWFAASTVDATTASFRNCELLTNTPTSLSVFPRAAFVREGTLDTAQFLVVASRNGPLQADVNWSGTAVWGTDYAPVSSPVLIPEGTNSVAIPISPINDAIEETPETVELSLPEQPGLDIAEPSHATALILDDEKNSGGLIRALYPGLGGYLVSDLTTQIQNPYACLQMDAVVSFETPTNFMDNYGQLLMGYLVPPVTGDYEFFVASDENSELWLSTDEDPLNLRLIARVRGWTSYRDYTQSDTHSSLIQLEAGRYYYIQAYHKEYDGDDCFSVAWKLPNQQLPAKGSEPISGNYLAFSLPPAAGPWIDPPAAFYPAQGGTGSIQLTMVGSWTASSLVPWILQKTSAQGFGAAAIDYQVLPNYGDARRVGTIAINGHAHSVIQNSTPSLQLTVASDHSLGLTVINAGNYLLVVEASDDLRAWQPIYTNHVLYRLNPWALDASSTNRAARFYRVLAR
jgi:M6 family metalloprotease-like protein